MGKKRLDKVYIKKNTVQNYDIFNQRSRNTFPKTTLGLQLNIAQCFAPINTSKCSHKINLGIKLFYHLVSKNTF